MNIELKWELNRLMKKIEEVQIKFAHNLSCYKPEKNEFTTDYDIEMQPSTNHPYCEEKELP